MFGFKKVYGTSAPFRILRLGPQFSLPSRYQFIDSVQLSENNKLKVVFKPRAKIPYLALEYLVRDVKTRKIVDSGFVDIENFQKSLKQNNAASGNYAFIPFLRRADVFVEFIMRRSLGGFFRKQVVYRYKSDVKKVKGK